MKQANQLTVQPLAELAARHNNAAENCSKSKQQAVEVELALVDLWESMNGAYGSVWIKQYGDVDGEAFGIWLAGLSPFSPEQIKMGFENMVRDRPKFPPNLFEFLNYCCDLKAYGLPDPEESYQRAVRNMHHYRGRGIWAEHWWVHKIEPETIRCVGISIMKTQTDTVCRQRYLHVFGQLTRKILDGEAIESAQVYEPLPGKIVTPLSTGEKRARIAKMKAELNL